jgi:hypothetical protein
MEGIQYADLVDAAQMERKFKRFDIQFTVLVKPMTYVDNHVQTTSSSQVTAIVTNVSMSGMGFESAVAFDVDTSLLVVITVALKTFELPVVVRRCSQQQRPGRTVFTCGVQYVKSPSTTEFIPTLAKYLQARGILRKV